VNRLVKLCWSTAVIAIVVTSGCGWFHSRDDYYTRAVESRPLEVPPDLDAPPTTGELVIPGNEKTPPVAAATGTTPPAVALSGATGLHLTDTVDNAWRRVGMALERAQLGTIRERDPVTHSYTLEVSGLVAARPTASDEEHHWYTRILHPFGGGKSAAASDADSRPVSGRLTVKVAAEGDGARIDVESATGDTGSAQAAARVLAILRERLG
jgi:uncharacterized lipoprotein